MSSLPSIIQYCRVCIGPPKVHFPTHLLQLRPTTGVSTYVLLFLRHPIVLITHFDVPPQTIDSIGVSPLPMNINIPSHTSSSFRVLPREPFFGVLPTPHTSRHASPPALRRHLCHGILPLLSTWHQLNRTGPYPDFIRNIQPFVSWARLSTSFSAMSQWVHHLAIFLCHAFCPVSKTFTR